MITPITLDPMPTGFDTILTKHSVPTSSRVDAFEHAKTNSSSSP